MRGRRPRLQLSLLMPSASRGRAPTRWTPSQEMDGPNSTTTIQSTAKSTSISATNRPSKLANGEFFSSLLESIDSGANWSRVIREWACGCDILLMLVGPGWGRADTESGVRRLDRPDDYVRIELTQALLCRKRIVPVLVNGARMPEADMLPQELQIIAQLQAE